MHRVLLRLLCGLGSKKRLAQERTAPAPSSPRTQDFPSRSPALSRSCSLALSLFRSLALSLASSLALSLDRSLALSGFDRLRVSCVLRSLSRQKRSEESKRRRVFERSRCSGALLEHRWSSRSAVGGSWIALGVSRITLGGSRGALGAFRRSPEEALERSWGVLEHPWRSLGPPFGALGAPRCADGHSWGGRGGAEAGRSCVFLGFTLVLLSGFEASGSDCKTPPLLRNPAPIFVCIYIYIYIR